MTASVANSFIPSTAGTVVAVTSFSNDINQLVYDYNPPKMKGFNREKPEAMVDVAVLAADADDAFFWLRQAEAAAAYHIGVEPVARASSASVTTPCCRRRTAG